MHVLGLPRRLVTTVVQPARTPTIRHLLQHPAIEVLVNSEDVVEVRDTAPSPPSTVGSSFSFGGGVGGWGFGVEGSVGLVGGEGLEAFFFP